MILDSDAVTLTTEEQVDSVSEQYALKPVGTDPDDILDTDWSDTMPDYIDKDPNDPQQEEYEYWTRQVLQGHDETAAVGFTRYTQPVKDKDLTIGGKTAAMVRQYSDGILVCRKGSTVGALVNADGSFDVAQVSWSGDIPTAGAVLASYGSDLMVMRDSRQREFLRMENLAGSDGVTITETLKPNFGTYPTSLWPTYTVSSITSVTKRSDSSDITSSCSSLGGKINVSTTLSSDELLIVTYVTMDSDLKAYTFGDRSDITTKGAQSMSVGSMNAVSGMHATAIGRYNTVTGNYSAAIGGSNSVSGVNSVAIGGSNTISKNWALVVGNNSTANRDGQIVFGNDNTPDSAHKLELVEGGINIFTVNANTGGLVTRNPSNQTYGYINAGRDGNGDDYLTIALYDNGGVRNKRISLMENNILVDGVEQFYKDGETLSFTVTGISFSGYSNANSKTIRFMVPVGKSLQFVDSFTVLGFQGGIFSHEGYAQYTSGTPTTYNTDWTSYCNFGVTKISPYMLMLSVTLKSGNAFGNLTAARPVTMIPNTGGLRIQVNSV